MTVARYSVSIEPGAGPAFIHADVVGTESEARSVPAQIFRRAYNGPGQAVARTAALLRDAHTPRRRRIVDVFDGRWLSESGWDD